jgi:hypothetical protein
VNLRIVLRSGLAGIATSLAVGATRSIAPQGGVAGAVCDGLALPGALMLSVWFPEGPHSGHGVAYWGILVLVLNLVLYSGLWLVVLLVRAAFLRRRSAP